MRPWSRRFAVIAALTLFGPAFVHAAQTPGQKCAVAKSKAAAKKASSKLKCYQKAIAAGAPVVTDCLMAAETKFNAAMTKAEGAGGCAIPGDGATLEAIVNRAATDLAAFTPATAQTCCTDGAGCFYVATPGACPFTAGAPGTVCDGATGLCVAAPAAGGNCCANPSGLPNAFPGLATNCAGGPELDSANCTFVGGTIFVPYPNGICAPDGSATCARF